MLGKLTLTYLTLIFFFYSTNLFGIENKILVKIEEDIITTIDVENESKYLLLLNQDIKKLKKKRDFWHIKKINYKRKNPKNWIIKEF